MRACGLRIWHAGIDRSRDFGRSRDIGRRSRVTEIMYSRAVLVSTNLTVLFDTSKYRQPVPTVMGAAMLQSTPVFQGLHPPALDGNV